MNTVEKIKNVILSNCVDDAERKIGVEIEGLYYTDRFERLPVNTSSIFSATDLLNKIKMDFTDIIKLIIGLGLINVWVLRYNKKTEYRGGAANNMLEEFHSYGLSRSFMFLIGFFKISLSLVLILSVLISDFTFEILGGINLSSIVFYGLCLMSVVMVGSVLMHLKIKDPFKKSIPAFLMFLMSTGLVITMI